RRKADGLEIRRGRGTAEGKPSLQLPGPLDVRASVHALLRRLERRSENTSTHRGIGNHYSVQTSRVPSLHSPSTSRTTPQTIREPVKQHRRQTHVHGLKLARSSRCVRGRERSQMTAFEPGNL